MSPLARLLAALALFAAGCTSCAGGGTRDAGLDGSEDSDVVLDADADGDDVDDGGRRDGDLDIAELADADSDADVDVDSEGDADALPAPVAMELVEQPRDRPGLDCGPGCQQLTFADGIWSYDISERYLSYMGSNTYRLYLVDLQTMVEYQVDECHDYQCSHTATQGDLLVYATGAWDDDPEMTLWQYRIGDSLRHPLVNRTMTNLSRSIDGIDISGGLMAWYDSAIDPAGLYVMSLYGGEVSNLTNRRCVCYGDPSLVGSQVVYDGWQTGNRDIWLVNVDTLEEEQIVDHPAPQFDSAFDGRWVVWTDGRNDPSADPYGRRVNPDIYGMNLETREVEVLCDHPATQLHPDVRDGLVAWGDWRNAEDPNDAWVYGANVDIYLLDLATRREVQVTSRSVAEGPPRIWGRKVFFGARDATNQGAVFVVDLDEAGLLEPAEE